MRSFYTEAIAFVLYTRRRK